MTLKLSNARVQTWQRCEKKYEFQYVRKLRRRKTSAHLARGSWLHELLMALYDGEDWIALHKENVAAYYELSEEEREDLGDLPREIARIMRSYIHHWKSEDAQYRTVDSEIDETIELPGGIEFQFIIDHIVEDEEGGLWLRDHKSVSRWMPPEFMLLDAQLTRYYYCAEQLGYKPLMGIEFNEILTTAPTVPELVLAPGQKKGGRKELTKRKNLRSDYWTYLATIKKNGFDPKDYKDILLRLKGDSDEWFRRSAMPKDEPVTRQMMGDLGEVAGEIRRARKRKRFPRSPRKECTWDCEFLDACVLHLQGGDISDIIKQNFVKNRKEE